MTLRLHYHPFSSFCQKVLIALYERDVAFERQIVDLRDPAQRAALAALWPLAKFPVLRDEARAVTVPEASLIVGYLDRVAAGDPLVPADPDEALRVHMLDRFFDLYVEVPLQKVVADTFRPEEARDAYGVDEARNQLATAWPILEQALAESDGDWAAGKRFTLADCAAAPALFYANIIVPFSGHARLEAYYARLLARPSFARAVEEARPYRSFFPLGWPDDYL